MKLVVEQLRVERGERPVFDGLSLEAAAGTAIVVTGPNGSGKSTLLKAVAGFLRPATGRIVLEGSEADTRVGEHCHYLSHSNALKAQLSVGENLAFWQSFWGCGMTVPEALERVALPGVEDIPAGYLSAGQKRRVAIARLLVAHRPVWLLDEPTAALDAASERLFAGLVEEHLLAGGIAVAATHQPLGLASARALDMSAFSQRAAA